MKKKLNIAGISSELRGNSAFFPGYKGADKPPATPTEKVERMALPREPERSNARTPVRPNGKRIITRNSFEIYEDQMDALRERSFQEKRKGALGSMSAMVRDAIDRYLKTGHSED
jgi:hypothetical protein